jgi:hypothetical protein
LGVGDHAVDDAVALGFVKRFLLDSLLCLLLWCFRSDPMNPVLDSGAVYLGVNVFFAGDLDKDQEGVIVSIADFSSQSDVGESFYQDSELSSGFGLAYVARLVLLETRWMLDLLVFAKRKTMM